MSAQLDPVTHLSFPASSPLLHRSHPPSIDVSSPIPFPQVASTETGHIFGTIVYSGAGAAADATVINLSEIHCDIMDYIHPATCSDATFRSMWADFEWENKVSVNTNIK